MAFKSLSPEEQQEFYSKEAMDRRCTMRHARDGRHLESMGSDLKLTHATVLNATSCLRNGEHVFGRHPKGITSTFENSIARRAHGLQKDWNNDSKGHATMSFERFKDAPACRHMGRFDGDSRLRGLSRFASEMLLVERWQLILRCQPDHAVRRVPRVTKKIRISSRCARSARRWRARERREAALLLQRQQRVRQQQKAARERVIYEQELLARAMAKRGERRTKLHEAELEGL